MGRVSSSFIHGIMRIQKWLIFADEIAHNSAANDAGDLKMDSFDASCDYTSTGKIWLRLDKNSEKYIRKTKIA